MEGVIVIVVLCSLALILIPVWALIKTYSQEQYFKEKIAALEAKIWKLENFSLKDDEKSLKPKALEKIESEKKG